MNTYCFATCLMHIKLLDYQDFNHYPITNKILAFLQSTNSNIEYSLIASISPRNYIGTVLAIIISSIGNIAIIRPTVSMMSSIMYTQGGAMQQCCRVIPRCRHQSKVAGRYNYTRHASLYEFPVHNMIGIGMS